MKESANEMRLPGFTAEAALIPRTEIYPKGYSESLAKAVELGGAVQPAGLGWFTACYLVTFGHPGCLLTLLIPE